MQVGMGSVAVLVTDADKSSRWYRDVLGFEVVEDKGHAVFVRPQGSQALIHLCEKCDAWEGDHPGGRTGIWLSCGEVTYDRVSGTTVPASRPEEVERAYMDLKSKGVEFSEGLTTTSWGKYAILRDPDGNEFEIS